MRMIITDDDRPQAFGFVGFVWGLLLGVVGGGPSFSFPAAVVSFMLMHLISNCWRLSSGSQQVGAPNQERQENMRNVGCGMAAGIFLAWARFPSSSPDTPAPTPSPTSRI